MTPGRGLPMGLSPEGFRSGTRDRMEKSPIKMLDNGKKGGIMAATVSMTFK